METKKNSQADLEKSKFSFLLFGAIVAISFVIFAFSWSSVQNLKTDKFKIEEFENETVEIITVPEKIKLPEPVKEFVIEKIIVNEKVETPVDLSNIFEPDTNSVVNYYIAEEPKEEPKPVIYAVPQEKAEFPGGELALRKWLANEVVYPVTAMNNGISGKVYLQFVVNENGDVSDVKVSKGKDPLLDEEALRVVRKLPKFKPGKNGGKNVKSYYSIPINFILK